MVGALCSWPSTTSVHSTSRDTHTTHNLRRGDKKFTFFESFYEVLLRWNIRYPDMQSFDVAKLVFCLSWPSHFLSEYGHLTLESLVFGHWTDAALNVWSNHKSCSIDWDSGGTGDWWRWPDRAAEKPPRAAVQAAAGSRNPLKYCWSYPG